MAALGRLEPGEPRRQLEQQRQELPIGESQQEHPGQPQQQRGLPPPEHGFTARTTRSIATGSCPIRQSCVPRTRNRTAPARDGQ